jgi:hypothetical protein
MNDVILRASLNESRWNQKGHSKDRHSNGRQSE